jgi:hypothetical protein
MPPTSPIRALEPINKPPFYAFHLYPGDVGTRGGLLCDQYSRVLDKGGDPIPWALRFGELDSLGHGSHLSGRRRQHWSLDGLRLHRQQTRCDAG